ncbi:uncharacterized protein LOC143275601 [Babylonia areolata]|uniref:uncharacterized protein LOC143275601 n=1 Tax=Babylonia areolata TaxID=304850 RepID=UPI003FD5D370
MQTMAVQAPLVTPKHYDPMFKVDIMLREPTLASRHTAAETGVDMMSLLTQFDILCKREVLKCPQREVPAGKTSSFFRDKASVVEDRLRQALSKAGRYGRETLQEYLQRNAVKTLFPSPVDIISSPPSCTLSSERTRFDDYLSCVSQLNQVRSLAHQLQDDVSTCPRPKYLAHQIALLYQSLMLLPQLGSLQRFKKSIEVNFKSVKHILATEDQEEDALPEDLRTWVCELCSQLSEAVESLPPDLTSPVLVPATLLARMAAPQHS